MQTVWKGTVSFGLVSIPVRLYAATEERNVSFRQVHDADGGRIRYRRVCEIDGEEVQYRDIAKGYEMPDGEVVILEKEDFESLPLVSSRVIDVLQFIPLDQLDVLMLARSYYVSAEGPGAKPYVLLRDALTRTDRVAIVKVALRNREQLAALVPRGDVLVLQTMLWPDEVRDPASLAPDGDVSVRDQEVAMAESYIETLTGEFDPDEYTDEYRHALEDLIHAKAQGRPVDTGEEEPVAKGNVVDLMAALRASVDAAKKRRAAAAGGSEQDTDDDQEPSRVRARPTDGEPAADDSPAADDESTAAKPAASKRSSKTSKPSTSTAKDSTAKDGAATGAPKRATKAAASAKPAAKTTASKPAAGKTAPERTAAGQTAAGKTATGKTAAGNTSTARRTVKASGSKAPAAKTSKARKTA